MNVDMTFDQFTRKVHDDRKADDHGRSLTETLILYLELAKPLLATESLKQCNPSVAPFPLTEWLTFVRNNWTAYDRQKTEFR